MNNKNIVIDASITGVESIVKKIDSEIENGSKFIITTITNSELKKLSMIRDRAGRTANIITSKAVDEPKHFKCILLKQEENESVDNAIVRLCKKNNYELWTGDKEQVLNARALGIRTSYFRQASVTTLKTLPGTFYQNCKLFFSLNSRNNKVVCAIHKGEMYRYGSVELDVHDEVYILVRDIIERNRPRYRFFHYRVVNTDIVENVKVVYDTHLDSLPGNDKRYKAFLSEADIIFTKRDHRADWLRKKREF